MKQLYPFVNVATCVFQKCNSFTVDPMAPCILNHFKPRLKSLIRQKQRVESQQEGEAESLNKKVSAKQSELQTISTQEKCLKNDKAALSQQQPEKHSTLSSSTEPFHAEEDQQFIEPSPQSQSPVEASLPDNWEDSDMLLTPTNNTSPIPQTTQANSSLSSVGATGDHAASLEDSEAEMFGTPPVKESSLNFSDDVTLLSFEDAIKTKPPPSSSSMLCSDDVMCDKKSELATNSDSTDQISEEAAPSNEVTRGTSLSHTESSMTKTCETTVNRTAASDGEYSIGSRNLLVRPLHIQMKMF